MKKTRCNKAAKASESLVVWGGNTLLELQRHIGVCEKHKAQLPAEVVASHDALLRELSKPYFKVIECQAVIEKILSLPRLVYPPTAGQANADELAI